MAVFRAVLCTILFINSTLFSSTFAQSDDTCKKVTQTSAHARLRSYIFCEYETLHLPSINENTATEVTISLAPKTANFNEETGNLEMIGLMLYEWTDPLLTWDFSSFDNIMEIKVIPRDIWEPMIMTLSAGNEGSNSQRLPYTTPCTLWHNGRILCRNHIPHTIRCQTDYSQWPFDRQNCTLVLSTWLRSNEQIRINPDYSELMLEMEAFANDEDWTMTATRLVLDQRKSSYSKKPNATSPRVSIDFIMDRVQNHLSGRFILPAIIMMVVTLTTLWLDPRSIERLALAGVNIIIHFHCIQDLHMVIPHNGSTVPHLLIFDAYSLILATIALLLTVLLGNLHETRVVSPKWISSSTAAILGSKVGQHFLLSILDPKAATQVGPDADDSRDPLTSSIPKSTAWGCVAIIFSWMSFLICVSIYILMYIALVPNSSMKPPLAAIGYFSPFEYM